MNRTCAQCEHCLMELVMGSLAPKDVVDVLSHTGTCPSCQQQLVMVHAMRTMALTSRKNLVEDAVLDEVWQRIIGDRDVSPQDELDARDSWRDVFAGTRIAIHSVKESTAIIADVMMVTVVTPLRLMQQAFALITQNAEEETSCLTSP